MISWNRSGDIEVWGGGYRGGGGGISRTWAGDIATTAIPAELVSRRWE